jgi:hypothetical protein
MSMAEKLIENSRQGFAAQKPPCTVLETDLSRNLRWGCGHVYDETPVGLAVSVRNDPVNNLDPDGRKTVCAVFQMQYLMEIGWGFKGAYAMASALSFVNGVSGGQNAFDSYYMRYENSMNIVAGEYYQAYIKQRIQNPMEGDIRHP